VDEQENGQAAAAPVVSVGALVRYVIEEGTDIRVPVLAVGSDGTLTLRPTDEHGKPYDLSAVAYDAAGAVGTWHMEG